MREAIKIQSSPDVDCALKYCLSSPLIAPNVILFLWNSFSESVCMRNICSLKSRSTIWINYQYLAATHYQWLEFYKILQYNNSKASGWHSSHRDSYLSHFIRYGFLFFFVFLSEAEHHQLIFTTALGSKKKKKREKPLVSYKSKRKMTSSNIKDSPECFAIITCTRLHMWLQKHLLPSGIIG